MAQQDWFRVSTWNADNVAEFETRLKQVRPAKHPEYLRLQGVALIESGDPSTREAGRAMLERVIREFPYNFESKFACEQLAASLAAENRLAESEMAYRRTIVMCKQSPIGYSGGSGVPELFLAEVLLRMGGRAVDAWELLDEVSPRVDAQKLIRETVYRHLLASARACRELGLDSAADFAARALAVADESEPAIPRHPEIGRPRPSEAERTELRGICDR